MVDCCWGGFVGPCWWWWVVARMGSSVRHGGGRGLKSGC